MAEYIEREALLAMCKENADSEWNKHARPTSWADAYQEFADDIENFPAADVVARCTLDQIRWERDMAMKQLNDHGIPFGGIAPDVVEVVRCKDCKYWRHETAERIEHYECDVFCGAYGRGYPTSADDFCSYGERRNDVL